MRKAQEQLHNQGLSVTLGSLDCALAQAFGLTGSLSDLGYQPRDLGPIQVRLGLGSTYAWTMLLSMYTTRKKQLQNKPGCSSYQHNLSM